MQVPLWERASNNPFSVKNLAPHNWKSIVFLFPVCFASSPSNSSPQPLHSLFESSRMKFFCLYSYNPISFTGKIFPKNKKETFNYIRSSKVQKYFYFKSSLKMTSRHAPFPIPPHFTNFHSSEFSENNSDASFYNRCTAKFLWITLFQNSWNARELSSSSCNPWCTYSITTHPPPSGMKIS